MTEFDPPENTGEFVAHMRPEGEADLDATDRSFAVQSALSRKYGERAVTTLIHIDALMTRVARSVERGRKWYDSDPEVGIPRLACEALAIKTGEAATRIPAGMREALPDIPWIQLSDLRNFLTHEYDSTDYNILWDTLEGDFPEVHRQVRSVLGRSDTPLS